MVEFILSAIFNGVGMAIWGVPLTIAVFLLGRKHLEAYVGEKGKNLATKEDIGSITKEVEKVKEEFNRRIEDLKAHHQLRLVAAERRMQAHQEAFKLWYQLVDALRNKSHLVKDAVEACNGWYYENCIFLGPASREAFQRAAMVATNHHVFEALNDPVISKDNWIVYMAPLGPLIEEVELPTMSAKSLKVAMDSDATPDTSPQ